jgi:hypothetical protein
MKASTCTLARVLGKRFGVDEVVRSHGEGQETYYPTQLILVAFDKVCIQPLFWNQHCSHFASMNSTFSLQQVRFGPTYAALSSD